jgi:integrase
MPRRSRSTHHRAAATLSVAAEELAGELPEAVLRLVERGVGQLAERAIADTTRRQYNSQWGRYQTWLASLDLGDLALPHHPLVIAAHLSAMAAELDAEGNLIIVDGVARAGSLCASSVQGRLAAIDYHHERAGHAAPGSTAEVRAVLAGIRRTYGISPTNQKTPIEIDALRLLLHAAQHHPDRLRDRALALVAAHLDPSNGFLADLHWDSARNVLIELFATGSRGVLIGRDAVFDALDDLEATLRSAGVLDDSVFGLSRSGVRRALVRLGGKPRDDRPQVLVATASALASPWLIEVRDTVLLLVGWWGALRRSNLVAADWLQLTPVDGGWDLYLDKQKNDQQRRGHHIHLPRLEALGDLCPAPVIDMWRQAVAEAVGFDPVGTRTPLLVPIDKHGRIGVDSAGSLRPLAVDSVTDIVKALVARTDLDPDGYASHSLRSGFVTEMLGRGATVADVAKVTGHKFYDSLSDYDRPGRAARNRVFGLIDTGEDPDESSRAAALSHDASR